MAVLDTFSLAGRVALVTGAGKGIGVGLALAYAEAGADVALVSRTAADLERIAEEIRGTGRRALVVVADVSQVAAQSDIVERVVTQLGTIDILANAAGVTRRQPVLDVSPADWDFIFNTNLRGVYFLCQAVGKVMIAQRRGKILNIASMNSYRGFPDVSVYGLTKAGIVHLTKSLAVEWARHGIQANAIAPGWIGTPMTSTMQPERRRWVEAHLPIGHYGVPSDLAGLAVYLASSASDYTTGQTFAVDGGFLAGNPWSKVAE